MGLDWIGLDGWLSYTAVTPRASLKSDANKTYIAHRASHSFARTITLFSDGDGEKCVKEIKLLPLHNNSLGLFINNL